MKRFLAVFLTIIVCASLFVGCNNETPPAGEDTVDTSGSATDAPATDAPTEPAEGGCGSVIGFSAIAVLAAAAAAVALKKD